MAKIAKTIKISFRHEEWLKKNKVNFSEWVRKKIDTEIDLQSKTSGPNQHKAVILAAGKDKDLFPLTEEIPKTLLDIKGKSILQRQVELLRNVGIQDVAVIRGYKKEKINYSSLTYFDNDQFDSTGSFVSLSLASKFMDSPTIVLYGDILFDVQSLKNLLETDDHTTLVVDRGWQKRYQLNKEVPPSPPELTTLTEKGKTLEIASIGVDLPITETTSEFIGLAKLSRNACSILKDITKNGFSTDYKQENIKESQIRKASFIDFIEELMKRGECVTAMEIWRSWIEVDTFEDYRNAWKYIDNITEDNK